MSDLQFPLDASLEAFVVRFADAASRSPRLSARSPSPADPAWDFNLVKWQARSSQPDEWLPIESGQVHVLLGRNGAGKSLLLGAVSELNTTERGFPSVSLVFRLPDPLEDGARRALLEEEYRHFLGMLEEFKNLVQGGGQIPADNGPESLRRRRPVIITALKDALMERDWTRLPSSEIGYFGPEELLRDAGFGEDEISRWEQRLTERPGLDLSELVPEFLLGAAFDLPSSKSDFDGLDSLSVPRLRFSDGTLGSLIVPAVKEFLQSCDRLEYLGAGLVRLLAPVPTSGSLAELLEAQRKAIIDALDDIGAQYRTHFLFPDGVVERCAVGGKPFVASYPFRLPSDLASPVVGAIDIGSEGDIGERLANAVDLLFAQLTSTTFETSSSGASLRVDGLEAVSNELEAISSIVKSCDLSIGGLRLSWPPGDRHSWVMEHSGEQTAKYRVRRSVSPVVTMRPRVEFHDFVSDSWLDVGNASTGQQQVIALLIVLAAIRADRRRGATQHLVLLGDEFDRHLHPVAGTKVLAALAEQVSELPGVTALVSTHHVGNIASRDLVALRRVVARRLADGFHYDTSAEMSLEVMAETLGVSPLDVFRTKRLFVVVEGNHDKIILEHLLRSQPDPQNRLAEVHIVNGRGVMAWSAVFENALSHVEAPVLLVYDNRHKQLESAWEQRQRHYRANRSLGSFTKFKESALSTARGGEWQRLTVEVHSVLELLRRNVFERNPRQALRVHLCGLDCRDIVDLLPIGHFPNTEGYDTWVQARESHERKAHGPGSRPDGKSFKLEYGINDETVRHAVGAIDAFHGELQRLLERIQQLVNS